MLGHDGQTLPFYESDVMTTRDAIATLIERVSSVIRSGPLVVHALAIGGSRGSQSEDDVSDLDLVVLLDDGPLVQQTVELKLLLDPLLLTADALGGGPSWKEGFGCRLSYLYSDGFKVEIFANTPSTVPVLPRPLRWTPVFGETFLVELQQRLAPKLAPGAALRRALFDFTYATMSIYRHLSRGELFAAEHVLTTMTASALALVLQREGAGYDPYASYKRIYRDRRSSLPEIVRLGRLAGGAFERAAMVERLTGLHDLMAPFFAEWAAHDAEAARSWQRSQTIIAAAKTWIG